MPTYTLQPDATDGIDTHIIDGSYAGLNYAASTQAPLGHQHIAQTAVNCHALLRFSLASLPVGSTINSATFTLVKAPGGSYPDDAPVFLSLLAHADWVETEATWNRYKTGSNWTTAGGDIQPGVATVEILLDMADTEIVFEASALVEAARTLGRTAVDFLVSTIHDEDVPIDYDQNMNVYMSDDATAARRPKLVIVTSDNYTIQAAQFYTAGAVAGMVLPNVVTGQEFTAGSLGGDVK